MLKELKSREDRAAGDSQEHEGQFSPPGNCSETVGTVSIPNDTYFNRFPLWATQTIPNIEKARKSR